MSFFFGQFEQPSGHKENFPISTFFCIKFLQLNIAREVHSRKPFGQEYGCWEKKH
jgi:hypothetical protein